MFRLILVLLLAGLIALAFYLGWVNLSTSTTDDQSAITLAINKGKIKESVNTLRAKVNGKDSESVNGLKETMIEGKIEAIDSKEVKVKTGSDQVITVAIARETEMQGDPRPGDAVAVSYVTVDNRHIATSVRKE